MSDAKRIWMILWQRATVDPAPFEISEAAPDAAAELDLAITAAIHKIAFVLEELARIPEGRQFFTREGNAVVPLPEFFEIDKAPETAEAAYPFED